MVETADIVVVGGGIIGCAVVQQLASLLPAGSKLVLLDRGPIAGATSGSCMGHLMVTPDSDQDYAFTATSVRLWGELEQAIGGFDYNPTGALYLADCPEDVELLPVLQQQFAAQGDHAEILDARQLVEHDPGLAADIPGGLFYRSDGVVLPMLACGAMLRLAQRHLPALAIRPNTAVTGFTLAGERITAVRTERGEIATAAVVLATGVWTPAVAAQLGLPALPIVPRAGNLAITGHHGSPIRTQLLEVSYLRFAHGAAAVDPTATDQDPGGHAVNMQPQTNAGCLIGSTRQFRGMDRSLNRELLRRSLQRAQRYVPGLRGEPIVRSWVGLRPYSLDKRPLIGPWPARPGLWLASGHEGLGITLAPVTGLLLAQQMVGQSTVIDATPYLPARFCA